MPAIYPIPTNRVSSQLVQARLLSQLQSDQVSILQLQQQIATGRRIGFPSEDAPAAQRAMSLQRLLEQKAQARTNLNTSQSYLSATDSAVQNVTNSLNQIRSTVLGVADTVSSAEQRQAAIAEVSRAIQQLVDTGNQTFRGRYLFAGAKTTDPPFVQNGNQIGYYGNETSLQSYSDVDLLFDTNLPGSQIFGGYSSEVQGTVDLNPNVTRATLLADLHGGQGITKGSIAVSDGTTTRVIDLSHAETVGDVADLISANAPAGRTIAARVSSNGLVLDLDDAGGGNLTVREVGGGTTAAELGIANNLGTLTAPLVGGDLNPKLRLTTSLGDVFGSRAQAILESSGQNNNVVVEARQRGAGFNGFSVQYVDDSLLTAAAGLTAGNEFANYSTTATPAQAAVTFNGFGNNLVLTGSTPGTSLNNVQIKVVDAGAIGSAATASYNSTTKVLTIGIDTAGGSEIQNVIAAINADGTFSAAHDPANPADGAYNPTSTIPIGDAGLVTGNTGNSGGGANTIFVHVQRNATTATQVLAAIQGNATISGLFTASLEKVDTTSVAAAGSGIIDLNAAGTATGGSGFDVDLTSGLQIVNGNATHNISFAGAKTVQDVLNTLNGSSAGVLAELNSAGDGIVIRSRLAGNDFSIGENGGNTASQFGVRSLNGTTRLDSLNHNLGVQDGTGTDFTIIRNDGTALPIDITGATTVQDVIDRINNHVANTGNAVVARLAQFGNGIELVDPNPGADSLRVIPGVNSNTATDLGFVPQGGSQSLPAVVNGGTQTLSGRDVNPSEVSSVFNSLLRIQDALQNFDITKLDRALKLLDQDSDRILFARSELGARSQGLDVLNSRLEDEDVELKGALSNEIDTDFTSSVSNLAARQASLQASLQLTAQAFQLSLLNYL